MAPGGPFGGHGDLENLCVICDGHRCYVEWEERDARKTSDRVAEWDSFHFGHWPPKSVASRATEIQGIGQRVAVEAPKTANAERMSPPCEKCSRVHGEMRQ